LRVLVVDDDPALSRMLALTLRNDGFDVVAAPDGAAALETLRVREPDLIVLDLEMPVMDGRQFYRELRREGRHIPVLVVSAYEARRGQRELGADGYLDKPFSPDELVERVRTLASAARDGA
jgi:DNA-binding response OmpR family regulator